MPEREVMKTPRATRLPDRLSDMSAEEVLAAWWGE